jgi:hypothetical protein
MYLPPVNDPPSQLSFTVAKPAFSVPEVFRNKSITEIRLLSRNVSIAYDLSPLMRGILKMPKPSPSTRYIPQLGGRVQELPKTSFWNRLSTWLLSARNRT